MRFYLGFFHFPGKCFALPKNQFFLRNFYGAQNNVIEMSPGFVFVCRVSVCFAPKKMLSGFVLPKNEVCFRNSFGAHNNVIEMLSGFVLFLAMWLYILRYCICDTGLEL